MNQWTNEHSTSVSPLRLIMDITLPTFARHQAWWTCHQCWRLMCYEWVTVRFSRSKTLVLHGSHGCHLATSLLAIWLLFTSHHCFWFTSYIHFLYSLLIFKVSFLFVILWNPDGFPPPVPSLTRDLDHFATEVWMTPMWAFVMRERCAGTSGDLRRPQGTTTRTRIGGEFWFPHSEGRWSLA